MPPEAEFDGKPENSNDLDTMVSSFLAELDALSVELETPPATVQPVAIKADFQPVPIPAETGRTHQFRYRQIVLISTAAILLVTVFALRLYFRHPQKTIVQRASPPPASGSASLPIDTNLNDTALLLAGRPVASSSPLYGLSASPAFQRHSVEMRLFWNRIRDGNLAGIRRWQEDNIPKRLKDNPVLYPLSGADYLNAYAFFPHARDYLLLSLEAPGELPDIRSLSDREIDESLSAIRFTVQSIASVNYLQSRTMREELTNSSFHGVIPLILLFAAGFGHSIRDVHPVMIGPDGLLVPDKREDVPGKFRRVAGINVPDGVVHGIQIQFIDGPEGKPKSITYLQVELRNQVFIGTGPEKGFLSGLKNRNAILKSAVYLLHGNGYSKVSEFIRTSSDLVLQDDSGIPYDEFTSSIWEEHLFGTYTHPQPLGTLTDPPRQPLLAQRYALGSNPLSFPYGYGTLWGKGRSNLMLFVKK